MKKEMMKIMRLAMAMIAMALAPQVAAQSETADITKVAEKGSREMSVPTAIETHIQAEISLVTCYPGSRNYELYGHTMIRVQIEGQDLLFNYGIFNFKQSGFIYRFVKGDCDYSLAAYPMQYLTQGYEDRKIVEQVLDLDDAQKVDIISFLWNNVQPENAVYRYGWAYNNCATKPRDIIENAVGGSLEYGNPKRGEATFRSIMAYFDKNYPWQQFGIDMVLGYDLDHKLDYREQMFSPIILMEAMADATQERDGKRIPVVKATNILVEGGDEGAVLGPTPMVLTPMFVLTLLMVIVLAVTIKERLGKRHYRWLDSVVFGVYGLVGVLVAFLTFVSSHYGTSSNLHIVWLHPLLLLPAIMEWIKRMRPLVAIIHVVNALLIVLLAAGWYWLPQSGNMALVPMAGISLIRSVNYVIALKRGCVK
ncbi:MAG: DUF4105 domain-containing protein [Muribaculaceae bacterium]|nr:DUF4105 domain-containing protein [Muribaculaceae bacterium]